MKLSSFFALLLCRLSWAAPTCISDSGFAIGSWFLIKSPASTAYMYSDVHTPLVASAHDLNSTTDGALSATLQQLWHTETNYILFNDEPLGMNSSSSVFGHTKGVWMWNDQGDAAILTHSVPLFPAGPGLVDHYSGLGANAYKYAQHMACFSTTVAHMTRLARLAVLTVPDIYDMRISTATPTALRDLSMGARNKGAFCNHTFFQTTDGQNITYFAKSSQWNNELYASCMAPVLSASLIVESWIRGSVEGPSCGLYAVLDVKNLNFSGTGWKETQDHSKWAVGIATPWVCPSDINRMLSQYGRGGSSFCYQQAELAVSLNDAITASDTCAFNV